MSSSQSGAENKTFQREMKNKQESRQNVEKPGKKLHYRSVGSGYWVAFLLPVSLYIGDLSLQPDTKFAVTIIAINVFLLCLFKWLELNLYMLLQRLRRTSVSISIVVLIICLANGGNLYQVASLLALLFTFPYMFYNLIRHHPRSFSFGEGALVTSAFAYRFWMASQQLPFPQPDYPVQQQSEWNLLTMFLQMVFFGTILGARVLLLLQKPWKLFVLEEMLCLWSKYCVIAFFTRIPNQTDEVFMFLLTWPFRFLVANPLRIRLICTWAAISLITGIYLILNSLYSKKTTTIDRKIFHLAIVLVFLPGVMLDHALIYCSSAVVFFLFVLAETLRVLKFEVLGVKIGDLINDNVSGYRDHQDEGRLLLTPIYLLVGCAMPIWLTTNIEDESGRNTIQYAACLAGILSIGIGDTFASVGGTYLGQRHWKDSKKTIEGTVCSIVSQIIFVVILFLFDAVPYDEKSIVALISGIIVNAIVEGNTNQIDNLILPLVTFIVIHGVSDLFIFYQ